MSSTNTSTKRQWIAEQAREHPERVFTTLHRFIDLEWMQEAYRLTRKDGAAGIDGVTAADYEKDLEANLLDLLGRIKSGSYFAPPVRRHHIPKADGTTRPLGIPTFEDKVAQRAIVMLLEPVYEADFLPCSYGFRPGRSAHDALHAVREGVMAGKRWVIDADISKYFDTIPHKHLREFLDLRIKDGVVRKMVNKWLRAGALEKGVLQRTGKGTPQGGVISPLIANAFLHYVLDQWFDEMVRPRLRGRSLLVRYADDAVMLFENDRDGQRVLAVLGKRLERYGLRLHPDKTRYLDFRPNRPRGRGKGAAFDFLGFTHYWVRTRKGSSVVRQTTAKSRFARALRAVNDWCRRHRHDAVPKQWAHLASVLRGHGNYYGLRGNSARLSSFRYQVTHIWRKWLSRRSHKARLNWDRMRELLRRYPLPRLRIRPATTAPLFPLSEPAM